MARIIIKGSGLCFLLLPLSCGEGMLPADNEASLAAAGTEPSAIYFMGDSVTAGFGYRENNELYADDWISGVRKCKPPSPPVDNYCSNNGSGAFGSGVPGTAFVSYSWQLAAALNATRAKLGKNPVPVYNYAVSGSTPAEWDVNAISGDSSNNQRFLTANSPRGGWYPSKLPDGGNAFIVVTLGANPLLSRWLKVKVVGFEGANGENLQHGCQTSFDNAARCAKADNDHFKLKEHLINIYTELLKKGNVLVQKYYRVCPAIFALNDTAGDIANGPSTQRPCQPFYRQMAFSIVDGVNDVISEAVSDPGVQREAEFRRHKIISICPGAEDGSGGCSSFDAHQFGSSEPWTIPVDTGIHPNIGGHAVLAKGVFKAACKEFGFYCDELNSSDDAYAWPASSDNYCAKFYGRCVFMSVRNKTPFPMTTAGVNLKYGQWYENPPLSILAGDTARIYALRFSRTVLFGTEGSANWVVNQPAGSTVSIGGGNPDIVHIGFNNPLTDLYGSGAMDITVYRGSQCIPSVEVSQQLYVKDPSYIDNTTVDLSPQRRCLNYFDPIVNGRTQCGDGYCFPSDVQDQIPNSFKSTSGTCDCPCIKNLYKDCVTTGKLPATTCTGLTGAP